jgi:hypothetical protein
MNIVVRLGAYFGGLWWDRVTGAQDEADRVRLRASQLRDMLTVLGPSFIKAGQVLANRPDIVREDYMNELCVLQVWVCVRVCVCVCVCVWFVCVCMRVYVRACRVCIMCLCETMNELCVLQARGSGRLFVFRVSACGVCGCACACACQCACVWVCVRACVCV